MGFFIDDPSDHPEALEVELAGRTFGWLLNKTGFDTAEKEGIPFETLNERIDEDKIADNLEALAQLIYIGTIPFRKVGKETPAVEEIEDVLTPRGAREIGPALMAQFEDIADERLQAEGK